MNAVHNFIKRVKSEARRKQASVTFRVFGKERVFYGYDWGCDTFIFEKNVLHKSENHEPILIVKKSDILQGAHGYIFTMTTGNHSVALIPLVSGSFWSLGSVNAKMRQKVVAHFFLYANVVNGSIEISQREADSSRVVEADDWLQSLGFRMNEVILADRNMPTLAAYRRQGQEWRVKPLAWTKKEMHLALSSSRAFINSKLRYYHSANGVHFLSYSNFLTLLDLANSDYDAFVTAVKELVFVYNGQSTSNMRTVKINSHHEIELFGLRIGEASLFIIPELERLLVQISEATIAVNDITVKLNEIACVFRQSLERPELADEKSADFIETMYIHLSGEIYQINSSSISTAFDAQRVALPGATFRGNRPDFHIGTDRRTKVLIYNIEQLLSNEEQVEYVNVYELRDNKSTAVGLADTREIVFKTNRRPLCTSLIEKLLALHTPDYGSYLLARVQAFKSLGLSIGDYRLLTRLDSKGIRRVNYFLRNRCPGEPLIDITPHHSNSVHSRTATTTLDRDVVSALALLLGKAAAQNMVMKKYIDSAKSCRFGEGKEIFDIGYDVITGKELPVSVMTCSMRGVIGWPDLSLKEENTRKLFDFYCNSFANVVFAFWKGHQEAISLSDCADRFIAGFECETKEIYWIYMLNRDAFDCFDPHLSSRYGFIKKWKFVLWALSQQHSNLNIFHTQFISQIMALRDESQI